MTTITNIKAWGDVQDNAVAQMRALLKFGDVADAALMADHHQGYSQPVGGVVAYRNQVSVSGVGYDIGCGNKAVKLDLTWGDIKDRLPLLADTIFANVEFGLGGGGSGRNHAMFDDADRWDVLRDVAGKRFYNVLRQKAQAQLGSVGGGNHYVDVFVEQHEEHLSHGMGDTSGYYVHDDHSPVWIGVHFGSRGFGWNIAAGFLKLGMGHGFDVKVPKGENYEREEPTLFDLDSDTGRAYSTLMSLAGTYAYAGRDLVCEKVAGILGGTIVDEVHNHHNYAWQEEHGGEQVIVVRKGATPLFPGQRSFIGGSMTGPSVIVEGMDTREAVDTIRSTVHGAGRVMGRMQAAGKACRRCIKRQERCQPGDEQELREDGSMGPVPCDGSGWVRQPLVTQEMMDKAVAEARIELRGAAVDESPFVYRQLDDVLQAHADSTKVLYRLRPVIVCMAPKDTVDPYKD